MIYSNRFLAFWAVFLMAVFPVSQVMAEEKEASGVQKVRQNLTEMLPGLTIGDINPTPAAGLYEVMAGQRIIYVTEDGRYLVQGSLIDLKEKKNLTEPRLNGIKANAVAAVGEDNMVIFGPEDAKHTITVFTDIDCGYCRKLHSEMAGYNDEGIRIRYLFYPRAGLNSSSYRKAVTVWCSDDRKDAMTQSKSGVTLDEKDCVNPVSNHLELGEQLGVSGTPAMVLESGEMIPGYVPPKRLSALLEKKK